MKNTLQRCAFETGIRFIHLPDVGNRESPEDPNELRAEDPKNIRLRPKGWVRTKQMNFQKWSGGS
jgi:hypothetical protein